MSSSLKMPRSRSAVIRSATVILKKLGMREPLAAGSVDAMGSNLQVQCQKRVLGGKGDQFFEICLIVAHSDAYVTPACAARFVDYLGSD